MSLFPRLQLRATAEDGCGSGANWMNGRGDRTVSPNKMSARKLSANDSEETMAINVTKFSTFATN